MPFLIPWMLLGATAGVIPVLIHLFFRTRYRTVPWAAMKFLLTSVEQTSRRLKFQEYLLMLTRIAVLVFLAIALAKPANLTTLGSFWLVGTVLFTIVVATWALAPLWKLTASADKNFGIYALSQLLLISLCSIAWFIFVYEIPKSTNLRPRGEGDAIDATFVFDTSLSMAANDGDKKNRLDKAKEQALAIIDALPPYSTVNVITCAGQTKTVSGPHGRDQAKASVKNVELTHLGTDLAVGIAEAQAVLKGGQALSKELYVFSDMQKVGFEQRAGELKKMLKEIKEKEMVPVHFVRCGERSIRNVSIVGITPQTGIPRPRERTSFSVLVRNTGADALEKLEVSLMVDGNAATLEKQAIPRLPGKETVAFTLSAKLESAGLHVLTARVGPDDLDDDNRFDQVILVRDQVNILVVDGNPYERESDKAERASSYYLMHALQPVREADRATYKYNPRMVPARLASSQMLKNQDICILVNCSLQRKVGVEPLATEFMKGLETFVRKNGHGLIIVGGDNVQPDQYNGAFGHGTGLLPLALKTAVKAPKDTPYMIDRKSFGNGPPAYWNFKDDLYYKSFDFVEVWQHLEFDEKNLPTWHQRPKKKDDEAADQDKNDGTNEDNVVNVIARLDKGKAIAVSRKVDKGEVLFFGTAAHDEGLDLKTLDPNWTNINRLPPLFFFLDASINYLMHKQTQTYNLVAGQTLTWFPTDKTDYVYDLVHAERKADTKLKKALGFDDKEIVVENADALPAKGLIYVGTELVYYQAKAGDEAGKLQNLIRGFGGSKPQPWAEGARVENTSIARLGKPEKVGKRFVVTASDLPRAGVHRLLASPKETLDAFTTGTPIAVIPDLTDTEDLTTLTDAEINTQTGIQAIHIIAGNAQSASAAAELRDDEAKIWPLLFVLGLILGEVVLAWWCGRTW